MEPIPDRRTTERIDAALRFDTGRSLIALYGPGVTDEFLGCDFGRRDIELELWEALRGAGFERIVYSRLRSPLYARDSGIFELRPPRADGAPRVRRFSCFPGTSRLEATGVYEPLASRAHPQTTQNSGGTGTQVPIIDYASVRQLNTWIRDPEVRTALIIVNAEDWFHYLDMESTLTEFVSGWTALDSSNPNLCLLLFRADSAEKVSQAIQSLHQRPVPGLAAYLDSFAGANSRAWDSPFVFLGTPEEAECDRLVQFTRLTYWLEVDWPERYRLATAMAAERRSARQWLRRFAALAGVHAPITSTELRRRGMLTAALPDGRSVRERLDELVGLRTVKEHFADMEAMAIDEIERRRRGASTSEMDSLHLIFYGNPGTGKTTVAGLVGELYRDMGLLRRGHVHVAGAADLIGQYEGQTFARVTEAVDRALDGVLLIDEAYKLTESAGTFGEQAINTLVELMEIHRARLVVIAAGYRAPMEEFLRANLGLASRFPEANRIEFSDYEPAELLEILVSILRARGVQWSTETEERLRQIVTGMYEHRKPGFGNAREMRILAQSLLKRRARRLHDLHLPPEEPLHPEDVPREAQPFLDRPLPALEEIMEELNALVGLEGVKSAIESLVNQLGAWQLRQRVGRQGASSGTKPHAPHLLFVGPPGTGKTTVARLMARIYHALGLLPTDRLEDVTAADLIDRYVGGSGNNLIDAADRARGGVLFIDEAHNLATSGRNSYGGDVIGALVPLLTNRKGQFAVIAAGYGAQMAQLFATDPGFTGRFAETIVFESYETPDLVEMFRRHALEFGYTLADGVLERVAVAIEAERAREGAYFANARAVERLFSKVESRFGGRMRPVMAMLDVNSATDETFRLEPDDVPIPPLSSLQTPPTLGSAARLPPSPPADGSARLDA